MWNLGDLTTSPLVFLVYRRGRKKRKGGSGVHTLNNLVLTMDILGRWYSIWITLGTDWQDNDWCAVLLYHPPKTQYLKQSLMDYIEATVDEQGKQFPNSQIILASDINQLSDKDISWQIGLTPIVYQPTRGSNILDQTYVSVSCYSTVRVIQEFIRRWDSECELFMAISHTYFKIPKKRTYFV